MARRIIAQNLLTREFLSWGVPLTDGSVTRELSGPGGITGKINPKTATLLGPDGKPWIEEWQTALYVEERGRFHGAGIVTRIQETPDGSLKVECPGFSTYPHGIINVDTYTADFDADALDVYRDLWAYVQSFPDADLGVTVDSLKSGVLVKTTDPGPTDGDVQGVAIRPYKLRWWEYHDIGEEMDKLLDQAVCDYIERHSWNDDHSDVNHHIDLGHPRLGKKRRDLRFVEGENVIQPVTLTRSGDDFAQNVYGAGRGKGYKMVHSHVAHRDGRLRRTALFTDKRAHQERLDRLTKREYQRRNDVSTFEPAVIKDHPNARITSINPGDDILVEAKLSWYGRKRLWVRVTSIEASLDDETAVLHVARSDAFRA